MRPYRTVGLASLLVIALTSAAWAQDADDSDEKDAASEPAPTKTAAADDPATAPPAPPAVETTGRPIPLIELLPPSAFPEPVTRGIPDGSLAGTFHGLQWPYYPKTGIGVSGYAWVDSGYETIKRGAQNQQDIDYWLQQGRVLLRVTPTYSNGEYFVQGQAELVANKDQSTRQPDVADTDDLWIKVGKWNLWDIQLGRYEGWEVYHFGMGLDLNTLERQGASDEAFSAPAIYGVTYAFNRPASVGQAAVHLYPTEWLRFELGSQFGNEFGSNTLATRPVVVFDIGKVKVKLGAEYKKLTDQKEGSKGLTRSMGGGGSFQVVLGKYLEAGVNAARGIQDRFAQDGTYDEKGSNDVYSAGIFANARIVDRLLVGGGFNYTYLEDQHFDTALMRNEKFNHVQTFGALQYRIVQSLYAKAVVAWANADFAPNFGGEVFENDMFSGRVRLLYLF